MKNFGLKIDEIKPENYVFGSVLSPVPFEELQPNGDWTAYLPQREEQNLNGVEPFACVAFTVLSCCEMLVKRQYGEDKNWSDRFLAAISGTQEGGNSPHIVCEFLRKAGVVPQELWPFDKSIDTFEKFYVPFPKELENLAKEFNNEWDFKHEYVPSTPEAIIKALKCSPLGLSVAAWSQRNGIYYKPNGAIDNHFTTLIKLEEGKYKRVFDSYADGEGDPFLKDYEWDTLHSVIKRFWIKKKKEKSTLTFWQRLRRLLW